MLTTLALPSRGCFNRNREAIKAGPLQFASACYLLATWTTATAAHTEPALNELSDFAGKNGADDGI